MNVREATIKEKLLNGFKLNEDEVEFVCGYPFDNKFEDQEDDFWHIDEEDRGTNRWSVTRGVIIGVEDENGIDRNFMLTYEHGLTEMQENMYFGQVADEVEKVEVTSYKWEKI